MESINIKLEVINLLELIKMLEGKYSKNYLIKVLKGNTLYVKTDHQKFPQFGVNKGWSENKLGILFEHLCNKEYISLKNSHKGIYEIANRGQKYLQKPSDFFVKDYELKPPKRYFVHAIKALKEERDKQAKEKNCLSYELCSNFQLEQIILNNFKNVEELLVHPVYKDWEGEVDWERMLMILDKVKKEFYNVKNLKKSANYQKIEELIRLNKSIKEITTELNIKTTTLLNYVESMYENGNENLKLWIYKNVNKNCLVKCIEYFTRTKNLKLREAKEELNLDYETIKLSRIYFRIQQITVAA